MAEYERFPLLLNPELTPYVVLECEGVMTPLDVDTGATMCVATLEQVRAWGLWDQVQPNDDDDDPVTLGYVEVGVRLFGYVYEFRFNVEDTDANLLGLNFLKLMTTIIDLENLTLTVREAVDGSLSLPRITLSVDGQEVEVKVDTACTPDMSGPLSVAQELGLSLTPCDVQVSGHGSLVSNAKYVATGLRLAACGREMQDC